MLAQRLRRWANISQALGQHVVFAGVMMETVILCALSCGDGD